ncbi:MAG: SAM-dependent methyltransferase [Myxococcota bacterium]|nr:SAM-dependent methyltransferase [Myxococcota bacterium]
MKTPSAVLALLLVSAVALAAHHEGDDLASRLASSSRAAEDRARDAGRKPAQVVAFLGIEPGMTVLDLIAAGGYYTEVLSLAVGPKGKVYAQNGAYVLKIRDGANDKALTKRLAGNRLPNVVRLDQEVADLELEPGSLDAALTALNFHDVYNSRGPEAADAFLRKIHGLLAPGGVLGIVDHTGKAGLDNEKLHRIEPEKVEAAAKAAGFTIESKTSMLRNPRDDGTKNVFEPDIRGKTDRFVLRLRKPR